MKVKLEDDGEDNSELIEEIEDSFIEEYIPLPGQYEINESRIIDLANAQDIWEDKILPLTATVGGYGSYDERGERVSGCSAGCDDRNGEKL